MLIYMTSPMQLWLAMDLRVQMRASLRVLICRLLRITGSQTLCGSNTLILQERTSPTRRVVLVTCPHPHRLLCCALLFPRGVGLGSCCRLTPRRQGAYNFFLE